MTTAIIAIGLAVLFALALYGILTGKSSGVKCSCGTGACGRPVDDPRKDEHADTDERLSAEHPPSDEELAKQSEQDEEQR